MNSQRHIIGIVGSYRKAGNIDQAVSAVLQAAQDAGADTQKIYLQDYDIQFCTNCRQCLQQPGRDRGQCILDDDMAQILDRLETANALVIGAPVNFGNVNALTQRFLERCICYAYWPWEQAIPQARNPQATKPAVLISSSAAPELMARWLTGAVKTLKQLAQMLSAEPIGTLWVGMADAHEVVLSEKLQHQAQALGRKLALAAA